MLTATLSLVGIVLLVLAVADRAVRRLPLTAALVYLLVGWVAGALIGSPTPAAIVEHAHTLVLASELVLLVSLFAVGVRLGVPPTPARKAWLTSLLLAGPTMVVTVLLAAALALWLLELPFAAALLIAATLAPTDPVLATDVRIRSERDKDSVRVAITAEGGLNDGTALPLVTLALGALGLHAWTAAASGSGRWGDWAGWAVDLAGPVVGGALVGLVLGHLLGRMLRARLLAGDELPRDELIYLGAVILAWGLARATSTSTFVVAFVAGVTMMVPLARPDVVGGAKDLATRLHQFGSRMERLVEATAVLAIGAALAGLAGSAAGRWSTLAFAAGVLLVARPLAVWLTVPGSMLERRQRALVAWFGIRGVGTVFYVAYAVDQGVVGSFGELVVGVGLATIALSIVVHGISVTPLMALYHGRRSLRG